jgi:aldehyde dehydrogenase (NAD+)
LSVILTDDEQDAIAIANDTTYGLNASAFTNDVERARSSAATALRHRWSQFFPHRFHLAFGGFK